MKRLRLLTTLTLPVWLAACAVPRPPATVNAPLPVQWQAPLPHGGQAGALARWWDQWNDPLLARLIAAAQDVSPTLASARSRLAQARAARTVAAAGLLPGIDGALSAQRSDDPRTGLSSVAQAGVQAGWEIDIFGANRSADDAAQARLAGAEAGWHEARVSVAAETAALYVSLRACEQLRAVTERDAASRAETARLTQLSADAGFAAPASAALARASAAEGAVRARQQRALCEVDRKTLVALTGLPEPELGRALAAPWTSPPSAALFAVSALPAQVLAQRPDVRQAELAVSAASADVGGALADRYPRLSLSGAIAVGAVRAGGSTSDARTWSIGPLALTLPLFDAGRRAAGADAAQARYEEAVALYRARLRQAASEVEQALVTLDSAQARAADVRAAAEGFAASYAATEARHRAGLASLFELEDARRSQLAAQTAVVNLQRELHTAWVSLYRAAGGGWQRDTPAATTRP